MEALTSRGRECGGRALLLAIGFVLAPSLADADGVPPPPPPPLASPCCEYAPAVWTGFYIGTSVGAAWSEPTWSFPFVEQFNTTAGQNFSTSASGALWGGHLGLNYQIHQFLIGGEVSYAGNRMSSIVTGPFPPATTDRFNTDAADLLLATGRIGFVHGQYLFYGKGGYANSLVELNAISGAGTTAQASRRESGWTVGGGLEGRIISNVIFGLEYNYVSLAGDRFTGLTGGAVPNQPFNVDINDLHMHTFTARLSVLFGPQACCGDGILGKY